MICCSHNHCGPSILAFYAEGEIHPARVDAGYKARVLDAVVDVAVAAHAALAPATTSVGRSLVDNVGAASGNQQPQQTQEGGSQPRVTS